MKKYLLLVIATIGVMVAYQSVNDEVIALDPVVLIEKPCNIDRDGQCIYVYREHGELIVECIKGVLYE